MSVLTLLCAGAATDPGPPGSTPFEARLARSEAAADSLRRLFRRGRCALLHDDDTVLPLELPEHAWLRDRFGLPPGESIEARSAGVDAQSSPVWRATPVDIRVGHYQLLLNDPRDLCLTLPEAQSLGAHIAPVFEQAGFRLQVASPLRWYLHGNADWELQARAWPLAVGRSIDGYLPSGARARDWRVLFTEAQIAWHDHPVNVTRVEAGAPAVNALWLDGLARDLPMTGRCDAIVIEPAIAGLIRSAGGAVVAAGHDDFHVDHVAATSDLLIDVDCWRDARRAGDGHRWLQGWERFGAWLRASGLASRLPDGFDRLDAVFSAERRCVVIRMDRGGRWRFWQVFDPLPLVLG